MEIKVGDRIKFRSVTRDSDKAVIRIVNGFWQRTKPTVRFQGYGDFIVHRHEVIEVIPA